ncbi:GumC domain-containing protein [Bacteroides timonensis]|uniref:hypothetical protein n=1 Tax=Bacteroides timonensis TaxID=1470345 RepID=UPI0004B2A58B|nr:hypothetical protein [Bacteroides timonensis]
MDISLFVSQFLYRIRYWLLWGTLFVTGLVVYFTQFLPYSYTVEGSLYAGITNAVNLDGTASVNVISTFDNLINIAKSRGTLAKVSIRLLANAYTFGEEWKDNNYIQAKHYRQLLQMTPKEVLALVDRKDVQKTTANLEEYCKKNSENFINTLFNRPVAFYGARALEEIIVEREGNSDILMITYTSADPGITQQTVAILIEELRKAYKLLRFKSTNDVIAYFEEQVRITKQKLSAEEDDLMKYCIEQRVINYTEESKALANIRYTSDDVFTEISREYESAVALRKMLDEKMDIRAKIIRDNTNLLNELEKVSDLNQNIMEQEIFITDKAQNKNLKLQREKRELKKAEENINRLSDNLNEYGMSKEGVGIQEMVKEWLNACVNEAKMSAEMKVMSKRQQDIFDQYSLMSPVGTQVSRKQRAIDIAEDNYRTQISGLAQANLQLKNLEMTTSNLQTIAPPAYPLTDNGRRRMIYVLIAFVGSLIFITTYFLLIELLDRTLRDPLRSKRLTKLPVIAAFNGTNNLKFRGFLRACNRLAAAYSCRQMNNYLQPGRPTIINLLSMDPKEGKSFLAQFFADYWKTEGLHVRIVNHDIDFENETPQYVQAQKLSDFWMLNEAEKTPDIILVEYPAISTSSIPLHVLEEADLTLLIANARRLWSSDNDALLEAVKKSLENKPFFLYLNNADRETVEMFTGKLPPNTLLHSWLRRMAQLGLTSQKAAVK